MNQIDFANQVLREQAMVTTRPAARSSLVAGSTAVVEVRRIVGEPPLKSGEIHIVRDGEGDLKARPAKLAWNSQVARRLSATEVGGIVEMEFSDGTRCSVEIVSKTTPTKH